MQRTFWATADGCGCGCCLNPHSTHAPGLTTGLTALLHWRYAEAKPKLKRKES